MADYHGDAKTRQVWVTEEGREPYPLPLRLDLANHSPDGFEWGYEGSGPAQLALAILAHHLKIPDSSPMRIPDLYQLFKRNVIAKLPRDADWWLSGAKIDRWLSDAKRHLDRVGDV